MNEILMEKLDDMRLLIAKTFKQIYESNGTEQRALIYFNELRNEIIPIFPKQENTKVSTTSNVEFYLNDNPYCYLVEDIHSHHTMGANFSEIDNENEKIKNIIFTIIAWDEDDEFTFNSRKWDGEKFNKIQ